MNRRELFSKFAPLAAVLTTTSISCDQNQKTELKKSTPEYYPITPPQFDSRTTYAHTSTRPLMRLQIQFDSNPENFSGIFITTYTPEKIKNHAPGVQEQIFNEPQNIYFEVIAHHIDLLNSTYIQMLAFQLEPHLLLFQSPDAIIPSHKYPLFQARTIWTPEKILMDYSEGSPHPWDFRQVHNSPPGIPVPYIRRG